jgi:uncharacterized membrane protein YqiK
MGSIDLSTNSKRHRAILASAQKHQKSANETLNRLERSIIGPLQDRIEDVHRQAAAKIAEAERRVQAFRAGCEAEINACVGNVSALALRLRQAVDASSGNGATELERLAKCCQAREVSTKSTFPPLRRIQSSGYSSGERPSESDLRRLQEQEVKAFWDSFGYDEKQKLAQLLRVLGERESSKLLEALMDMTPSERRNVLRGLPIF